MRWLLVCGAVLLLGMRSAVGFEVGHVLVGEVSIIDGDTLEIAGSRVRLNGLTAPERDEQGGPEATDFMKRLTADAVVRCVTVHTDRYDDSDALAEIDAYDRRRDAKFSTPPENYRMVEEFGAPDFYGWSDDKARQYAVPQRKNLAAFLKSKKFNLD